MQSIYMHFIFSISHSYGARHPQFHGGTLQDASVDSLGSPGHDEDYERYRPLVLYLHNDNDPRVDMFAEVSWLTVIGDEIAK